MFSIYFEEPLSKSVSKDHGATEGRVLGPCHVFDLLDPKNNLERKGQSRTANKGSSTECLIPHDWRNEGCSRLISQDGWLHRRE